MELTETFESDDEIARDLTDAPTGVLTARNHHLAAMPACNIVLLGKTGVGKSTLLNAVFGQDLARTGVGRPVTQHIEPKSVPGLPVQIIDTRGIELTDDLGAIVDEFVRETEKRLAGPECDWFHVLWYCVSSEGARFEEQEGAKVLNALGPRVKTIVVMTRCLDPEEPSAVDLRQHIVGLGLPVEAVIPVLALERKIGPVAIPTHGLEDLVALTADLVPDAIRQAFVNSQVIEIEAKVEEAFRHVDAYVDQIDTRYRPLAFLEQTVITSDGEAERLASRVVHLIGELSAIFGTGLIDDETLHQVAVAALGEGGSEAVVARVVNIVGNILLAVPPVGVGTAARYGGKLLSSLAAALGKNHVDVAARKRAAIALRVIGRSCVITLEAAARAHLSGEPLTEAEVVALFGKSIDSETRTAADN